MNPVRKVLVDVLAIFRGHERCNDEVDVAEKEEDDDWVGGLDRRIPVPLGTVTVEMDQSTGNEDVDDGKRVGDEAVEKLLVYLVLFFPFICNKTLT